VNTRDEHLRDMIAEQAADYFVAHRDGGLSDEQEQEFLRWLRTSPLHVAEYLGVAGVARDVAGAAKQIDMPLDELIASATGAGQVIAINITATPFEASAKLHGARRAPWRRGVVIAAYAAVAAAALFFYFNRSDDIAIAAGHGELRTWQLADNTIIHLNSDSAVSVRFDQHRRLVEIVRGEVYFEVAKDSKRPFEVRAGNTTLQDIGTAFDVFRQDGGTLVSVVEGQVAVKRGDAPGRVADLHAGEQAAIFPSHIVKTRAPQSVEQATAWLRQEIVFDRTTIAAAASQFNRYTQTQIVVDDPRIAEMAISGVFHLYDLASFAQFLNGVPGVEAVLQGNTLHVMSNDRGRQSPG
jgi:transmembrane sensor